jgi:ElaB/YqjD/DUF883 family membrane-anchored ribosome-binding protein
MSEKDDEQWLAALEKDDRDWLKLLAGQEVPNADPNTLRETRGLREAVRAEKRLQKMKARLVWHRIARRNRYRLTQMVSVFWEFILNPKPQVAVPAAATLVIGLMIGWLIPAPYSYQGSSVIAKPEPPPVVAEQPLPSSVIAKSEPPPVVAEQPLPTSGPAQIIEYSFDAPQQVIAELKEEFMSSGAKTKSFQIDIQIPEQLSDELREISDTYDLDLEKINNSPTRVVRFIVSHEE